MFILDADFMQVAFATGAVVGVLAPAVGFFLVQRQMSLIGDGIGHAAFAGVAAGYLLDVSPVGAALVAATLAAVGVEWLRTRHRAAGDQALALIFYSGIAAGVVLVSAAGALNANLFSFLFGSILTVTWSDFALVAVLGAVGLAVIGLLYRGLVAVALDEDGARVSGLPIEPLNVGLAALAGVTVAVSMRIVGILLIAALMVLPVIAAGRFGRSVRSTMFLSSGIGLASVVGGLTIAYYGNLAPGGAIVLLAAGFAVAALAGAPLLQRAR